MMEVWKGLSYDEIMAIPSTRRVRLIHKKIELERKREQQHNAQMARRR